jgi:hypothetical protein
MPWRTYQNMESGNVPQKKTLAQIVKRLGLKSETVLFLDPDFTGEREGSEERRELLDFIAASDESKINAFYGAVTQVSEVLDRIKSIAKSEQRRKAD